ncbi:MAG TPA: hypothetical protein PK031_01985, partial [Pseudomonadales bacterium]|nr:hypothetical protein [Pseudomonadales bacterium]
GNLPGYQSTPFDTYWAFTALDAAGQLSNNSRSAALGYLLRVQRSDCIWAYQGEGKPYGT